MRSLKLCDTQTPNDRKTMYIVRSGDIYKCLGNIYYLQYKRGCSNARRKKLLNLCRLYYGKSLNMFKQLDSIAEFLNVQIDRLELQNTLFEGIIKSHSVFGKIIILFRINVNFRS